MDPLSHAVTGAILAQAIAPKGQRRLAGLIGGLAGLSPDLDVFIRSSVDPLVFLEYHRQFTHSLIFVPVLALLCAGIGWLLFRKRATFPSIYLYCFLGILPHGLLDAFTSYGTYLWWPFSNERVASSHIAIVDLLYTVPLLVMVALVAWKRWRGLALFGLVWASALLAFGGMQRDRAEQAMKDILASEGIVPVRVEAKPTVLNRVLFRVLTETETTYRVDAVRVSWSGEVMFFPGEEMAIPSEEDISRDLPPGSLGHHSIQRFAHFSQNWLYFTDETGDRIGDLRYAMIPNSTRPLWYIVVDRTNPESPVEYLFDRDVRNRERFLEMVLGRAQPVE